VLQQFAVFLFEIKMVFLKGIAAAACAASALAVDILVHESGGNVTGKFGHPFGYGFLHEVNCRAQYEKTMH